MEDIIAIFAQESAEGLAQMRQDLARLQEEPGDAELIMRAYRTVHTIKGTCGFLSLFKLEKVAQAGQDLLRQLKDGAILYDAEVHQALGELNLALDVMVEQVKESGREGQGDYDPLLATLHRLRTPGEPGSSGTKDRE